MTPLESGEDPTDDPALDEVAATMDTHILCHSDTEGFYVPIEFREVILDLGEKGLPGGMLGSTQTLMRELIEVAAAIGIHLIDESLSDAEVDVINADSDEAPFFRERLVWLALFENARVSIANRCLLVFC